MLQIHRRRQLLPLKKLLPQQLGQNSQNPLISEKQVITVAKLSFCLKGFVICLQFGKPDDFGDGYGVVLNLLFGDLGGEFGGGAVVDDEAELRRGVVGEERVWEGDFVWVYASGCVHWWNFLEG